MAPNNARQFNAQRPLTPDPMTPTDTQSEPSSLLLGAHAEAIIKCNQKLQQLGIDDTIKLPQICVIGDQSTGKSSLIEALSTIKVPKAERLCTQCPLAINLNSGQSSLSSWTCTISIEQRYDYNPDLASKAATKKRPFGPWELRREMEVTEFQRTSDKEEVCGIIKSAQSAVLNPGVPYEQFRDVKDVPATNIVKFSPNVIRIDVSEGSRPSLSFIDLPGVITNTGSDGDRYLVTLVENLANHYARDENGVIMLTLPLNHDRENSKAYSLVQGHEAQSRTLAVLTKPDLATGQQRKQCLHDLTHDSGEFQHGYHVVMMNSTTDMLSATGRDKEVKFFAAEPWAKVSKEIRQRLGVPALSDYIRQLLFQKTAESLPENLEAIEARLEKVKLELITLPPPPGAAEMPHKLAADLRRFDRLVRNLFIIDNDRITARNSFNTIVTEFRYEVAEAKPTLILKTQSETKEMKMALNQIQKFRKQRHGSETEPVDISSGDDTTIGGSTPKKDPDSPVIRNFDPTHRFRLEEIRKINAQHVQSTIPNMIEPKAIEAMNRLSVASWDQLLGRFLNKVSRLINDQMLLCVDMVFGSQKHLMIYQVIHDWVKDFLDEIITKEWSAAEDVCSKEQKYPLTLDAVNLKKNEDACITERMLRRKEARIKLYHTKLDAQEGSVKKRKEPSDKDLGDDEYDMELKMSAKTRAYYEIAGTRFSDTIVQNIFSNLLPHCHDHLVFGLEMHLGISDPQEHENIIRMMAEDPEREAHRLRLQNEAKHLEEGRKYIEDILKGDITTLSDEADHLTIADETPVLPTVTTTDNELALSSAPIGKRKIGSSALPDCHGTPSSKKQRLQSVSRNVDETPSATNSVRRNLERSFRDVQMRTSAQK